MIEQSYFKLRGKITVPLIFLFLLVIPLSSAVAPVLQTIQQGSLEILAPEFQLIPKAEKFDFYWHVFNTTNLLTNKTVSCDFHLYSKFVNGEHLVMYDNVKGFINGRDFEVTVNGANFTEVGVYCNIIECNTSRQTGGLERCFTVTSSGVDFPSSYFWLIILFGYGLIIFGLWKEDYAITTLGSFALAFVGLYMLSYGIDGIKSGMTNAFSIVTMVIAGYVMVKMGLNFIKESYD